MSGKILIVDDDSITRKYVGFLLRSEAFDVSSAQDGLEALEKIAAIEFDLVITDLNMPRMDGVDLIRSIRADSHYHSLPILMLTTESDEESRQLGINAGASEYMTKPVCKETLITIVRHWLDHKKAHC